MIVYRIGEFDLALRTFFITIFVGSPEVKSYFECFNERRHNLRSINPHQYLDFFILFLITKNILVEVEFLYISVVHELQYLPYLVLSKYLHLLRRIIIRVLHEYSHEIVEITIQRLSAHDRLTIGRVDTIQ
jgi:hypothetical protein